MNISPEAQATAAGEITSYHWRMRGDKDNTRAKGLFVQLAITAATEAKDRKIAELEKENTLLRALLPKLSAPCAHCGLESMSQCKHGFPGCPQADDLLIGESEHGHDLLEELRKLRAENAELKKDKELWDLLEQGEFNHIETAWDFVGDAGRITRESVRTAISNAMNLQKGR